MGSDFWPTLYLYIFFVMDDDVASWSHCAAAASGHKQGLSLSWNIVVLVQKQGTMTSTKVGKKYLIDHDQ